MLKREKKRPEPYRIVIIFLFLFLLLIEGYTFIIRLHTVKVSSFDVEIAGNITKINESKKTFSINDNSGNLVRTSKEYKEVLAVSWNNIAVIDTDNQLKIVDVNENVLVIFKDFSLDTKYITSTILFEEPNIIKINFVENKNGKDLSIDYCYNKDTKETYIIEKS